MMNIHQLTHPTPIFKCHEVRVVHESDVCLGVEKVLDGFVLDSYEDPHSYNLVILNLRMQGLNGFALYREIEKLRFIWIYFLHYLPIVLF
jgi:hypothetical protein